MRSFLPHARHRIDLTNRDRVAYRARRFFPATCYAMDEGTRIEIQNGLPRKGEKAKFASHGRVGGVDDMTLPIHALAKSRPSAADIDAFLAGREFPIVETPRRPSFIAGMRTPFICRHWIFALEQTRPFERIPQTDLWYHVMELPMKSRIEYKFDLVRNGHGEWIRDPRNTRIAHDPFGANSVCYGEGYVGPDSIEHDPESREECCSNSCAFSTRRLARPEPRPFIFLLAIEASTLSAAHRS